VGNLNFHVGDLITVTTEDSGYVGWLKGALIDSAGIFPAHYVFTVFLRDRQGKPIDMERFLGLRKVLEDTPDARAGSPLTMEELRAEKAKSDLIFIKPTCSINLVCYRKGAHGCKMRPIQTVLKSRIPKQASLRRMMRLHTYLVQSDKKLMEALRATCRYQTCTFWLRWFFLKTLRGVRLLTITPTTHVPNTPTVHAVLALQDRL